MTDSESAPRIAVFRPADERIDDAIEILESLGATPVADPMLEVEPAETTPRTDADVVVFTSKTGAELVAEAGWSAGDATVCAIGAPTADALRAAGYTVDVVPKTYSSAGLVDALEGTIDGTRVEVARSDHGSQVLLDGLSDSGAYVHETVLYRLVRPAGSGESAEMAASGDLDGALFTSSLTVEHFLEAAEDRGVRQPAIAGLNRAVVGAIGDPTRQTARDCGLTNVVVPETADFQELAKALVDRIRDFE